MSGRRAGDRRGRVVLEREGDHCRVARLIGTGHGRSGVGAVGAAVGSGAGAAGESGRLVAAVPSDRDRTSVPAVHVPAAVGAGVDATATTEIYALAGRGALPTCLIGAGHARAGVGAVRAAV